LLLPTYLPTYFGREGSARLLSRHLENATRFGALYAQRARRLLPPAVAGGAPTVAPCKPSARFHYCMACSGSSLERACAATPVEDVPQRPAAGQMRATAGAASQGSSLERASHAGGAQGAAHKATRPSFALG